MADPRPNTPRERLADCNGRILRLSMTLEGLRLEAQSLLRAGATGEDCWHFVRAIAEADYADSGLLDQANEGGGDSEAGSTAMQRGKSAGSSYTRAPEADKSAPAIAATVPLPSPAPASVEGEVQYPSTGLGNSRWVRVPASWPLGTKVRITRVSE